MYNDLLVIIRRYLVKWPKKATFLIRIEWNNARFLAEYWIMLFRKKKAEAEREGQRAYKERVYR